VDRQAGAGEPELVDDVEPALVARIGADRERLVRGGPAAQLVQHKALTAQREGAPSAISRFASHDLWAISPDGSNLRRLTAGPGDNESASWAPNGRHIIFQSNRQGGTQLYTMLADGTQQQVLTGGPGQASSPAWSPRLP